jgi:hypothetical protein
VNDLTEETEFFDEFELDQEAMDAGQKAAEWLLDGNSSFADAYRLFRGIEDGDPEVIDTFPSPLSGEHAGESLPEIMDRFVSCDFNDLSSDIRDEMCERYEKEFHDAFMTAARDEALEFMDQYVGEKLTLASEVFYRHQLDYAHDAHKMQLVEIFDTVAEGITKRGDSEGRAGTVSLEAEDCDCAHYESYCVAEYPDFTVESASTSRGQVCVWLEQA